jgi:hypothetical protein
MESDARVAVLEERIARLERQLSEHLIMTGERLLRPRGKRSPLPNGHGRNGLREQVFQAVADEVHYTVDIATRCNSTVKRVNGALLALRRQGRVRSEYPPGPGKFSRGLWWSVMPAD